MRLVDVVMMGLGRTIGPLARALRARAGILFLITNEFSTKGLRVYMERAYMERAVALVDVF